MDGWDIALLAIAGLVAASALARLMIHRRNQLIRQFLAESQREQQRKPPPRVPAKEGKDQ